MAELEAATGKRSEQLLGILGNLRGRDGRRKMLYSLLVYGRLARYFDTSVPLEHAQALVQREAEQMRVVARAESRRLELERKARHREKARAQREAARTAEQIERAKLRELAKAAAAVRKLDAEAQKGKRHRPMSPLKRGEHALSNALAQKIKADGTRGAAPAEKPAPTITWPEHITVQRAPRTPGRWEAQSVQPMFAALPLGQYLEAAA